MTEKASEADETELRLSLGPPSKPLSLSTVTEQLTEIKAVSPSSDKLQYNNNGLSLGTLSFPFAKLHQQELSSSSAAVGGLSSSTVLMGSTSSSIRQIMQTVGAAAAPCKPGFTPSKRNYSDALVNPSARPQPLDQSTNLNCSASVSVSNVVGRNQHQHHQPQLLHQALRWFPMDSGTNPVANTNPPRLPNPMTVMQQQQKQPIMNANKPQLSIPSPNDSCRHNSDNTRPVVGWPPVRSFRRNSLVVNNSKPKSGEEAEAPSPDTSADVECSSMYVKANMDGVPIGRKLDLKLYNGYPSLKQALGEMFQRSIDEYVLTHEDKDGDWMLVGDVPWDMFLTTVRRLRLMKSSELGTTPLVSMGDNRCPRPRAC